MNIKTSTLPGTALVTGASTGIGAVYAERLARRGYDLLLVARSQEKLEEVARKIRVDTGRRVDVLPADLASHEGVAAVSAELTERAAITVLVNNAGVGATAPLTGFDAGQTGVLIDLNVTALTRLTQAVLPRFVASGRGAIINIASVVGINPELLNGIYGATKAYVIAYTQALHHELKDKGVVVQAVAPGATRTPFWAAAGLPVENLPPEMVMDAEAMVDAALAGLDLGELVTVPSLPDIADWNTFEAARQALFPNLSRSEPAARYRKG